MTIPITETTSQLSEVLNRLSNIEDVLRSLVQEKSIKDWYSTSEIASLLGKAEYTVREWCRQGRVKASKKPYARGAHPEWLICHAELTRVRNEGLLATMNLKHSRGLLR
jgi:transposase